MTSTTFLPGGSGAFPRAFGTYVLLDTLGHGGMGEVYLAKAGSLEGAVRLAVLKTLRADLVKERGYLGRFLDEARVAVQLHHPNICPVFDAGKIDDVPYIAMEHIRGVNLRHLVETLRQQGRALPPDVALYIASEVMEGLDYAHRHRHSLTGESLQVVHRDVSPHNVMLSFEGDVKLIDFGLAQSILKEEQTESQVVMGKVAYMSPEQARGDETFASTDQFAAGVLTYEMLSGERFYGEMKNIEIWQIVGFGGFRPNRWAQLDAEVTRLLDRALAAKSKDRWPTCGELAAALRGVLARRYPGASRGELRTLLQRELRADLEEQEASLRQLVAVLEATPGASHPAPLALPANTVTAPADTNPTATWSVTRVRAPAPMTGPPQLRKAATVVMAAVLALAASVGVTLVFARGDEQAMVAPALIEPAGAAPAATEPAPLVEEPAPVVEIEDPDDARADVVAVPPVSKREQRRVNKRARRRAARATEARSADVAATAPSSRMVPFEQKLRIVRRCNESCAGTLRELEAKGVRLEPVVVDVCFNQCVK